MSHVILDSSTSDQLRKAWQPLELRDPTGKVLGRFIPSIPSDREPTIAEVELQRREKAGGGRTLREILADLEKNP